jgi:hypothetical protein
MRNWAMGDFGNTDPDYMKGIQILTWYFNEARKYSRFPYKDVTSMLNFYSAGKAKVLPEGVGMAFRIGQMGVSRLTDAKAQAAMVSLARKGAGQMPTNWMDFQSALNNAGNPGFFDAVKYVTVNTGKDLLTATQKIGDTISTTANVARWMLPMIPVVIVVGLLMRSSGKGPKEFVDSFRKTKKA